MLGRETAARVLQRYGTGDLKTIVKGERLLVRVLRPWKARFEDFFVVDSRPSPSLGCPSAVQETIMGTRRR